MANSNFAGEMMSMSAGRRMVLVLLSILLLAFVACSRHDDGGGDGAAEIVASTSSALTGADATSLTVTISAADIAVPITKSFVQTGGVWKGTIGGIPAGFRAWASRK